MTTETRYAKSGELHIAFQAIGEGPFDLVIVPGFISHLDHGWDHPVLARGYRRLASIARLILFDKRGTGLSDRVGGIPLLEERMDDVRAVMDAAGSQQAALFGISEGGAMAMLFAATYPERTRALALYGTYARYLDWVADDERQRRVAAIIAVADREWGTGRSLQFFAPDRLGDAAFRDWWARFERLGASPAAVIALQRMNFEIDVRHVLQTIRVPTLVLHRTDDTRVAVAAGKDIAARIPEAKFVELPGADHVPWAGNFDKLIDEIAAFLTGSRQTVETDRVLATVMFTDIVDSTRAAASLGDSRWREVVAEHDAAVRRELQRFRGREVKTMGDGFLAIFDGPARAERCARAIMVATQPLGIALRAGLHTGEVELAGDDVQGIAVHTAARVMALAGANEVLASRTVKDLVAGSGLRFAGRGTQALKGLAEPMAVFAASYD